MTGSPHEALHRIFHEDTSLFARALRQLLDIPVPNPHSVSILNIDLTEIIPVERRVDTLLMAEIAGPDDPHAFLIESQTGPDDDKLYSWPYYIAYVRAKYSCEVTLLVICSDLKTAEWARGLIEIGLPEWPTMLVRPIVFGPDNVPAVTDPAQASRDVTLSVFSALVHSRDANPDGILKALATALDTIDTGTAAFLAEFTEAGLADTAARQVWRAIMSTTTNQYVSQLRAEGRAEGRVEGEAQAVLTVLDSRGIPLSQDDRDRIQACTDLTLLDEWLRRAGLATSADELFGR
ncbi:hypothetical protein [Actinomadura sp. HBU206391]|uniref:hypothetical protein n=1 Tax=Actinomadura sp. HBU206391 TaxID=2731692 RepID=UPI00164F25CB|nr:hypothetical protein [Actinomadura sp. HBU206391]MBC6456583.1 hypothetical protein [Actinomadura sp. HBU206391]